MLLFFCTHLGQDIASKRKDIQKKPTITRLAEGTVFALLGLLIAFTFSGAYDRFEARKTYIIDDANSIERANLRIDLLAPQYQANLRHLLHEYVVAKIDLYRIYSSLNSAETQRQRLEDSKNILWQQAVLATKATNTTATTVLFITAINDVIDMSNKRLAFAQIHPPIPIFLLLLGLAMLSCFLIGHSLSERNIRHPIFVYSYMLVISVTLYIILDLELPRVGIIRLDNFDHLLVQVQKKIGDN